MLVPVKKGKTMVLKCPKCGYEEKMKGKKSRFKDILSKLCSKAELTRDEAEFLMKAVMQKKLSDAQIGASLIALQNKGVTSAELEAFGDSRLSFESDFSMVIRKSDYVDGRTLAIKANKAAKDIKRELIEKLKNPGQRAVVELIVDE